MADRIDAIQLRRWAAAELISRFGHEADVFLDVTCESYGRLGSSTTIDEYRIGMIVKGDDNHQVAQRSRSVEHVKRIFISELIPQVSVKLGISPVAEFDPVALGC